MEESDFSKIRPTLNPTPFFQWDDQDQYMMMMMMMKSSTKIKIREKMELSEFIEQNEQVRRVVRFALLPYLPDDMVRQSGGVGYEWTFTDGVLHQKCVDEGDAHEYFQVRVINSYKPILDTVDVDTMALACRYNNNMNSMTHALAYVEWQMNPKIDYGRGELASQSRSLIEKVHNMSNPAWRTLIRRRRLLQGSFRYLHPPDRFSWQWLAELRNKKKEVEVENDVEAKRHFRRSVDDVAANMTRVTANDKVKKAWAVFIKEVEAEGWPQDGAATLDSTLASDKRKRKRGDDEEIEVIIEKEIMALAVRRQARKMPFERFTVTQILGYGSDESPAKRLKEDWTPRPLTSADHPSLQ